MDEATQITISKIATQGGAVTSVGGWLLSNEFAVVAGLVVGVVGLAVNWFYRHRQDRRDEREHRARMRALREQ
jgi:hypothetical protein